MTLLQVLLLKNIKPQDERRPRVNLVALPTEIDKRRSRLRAGALLD